MTSIRVSKACHFENNYKTRILPEVFPIYTRYTVLSKAGTVSFGWRAVGPLILTHPPDIPAEDSWTPPDKREREITQRVA